MLNKTKWVRIGLIIFQLLLLIAIWEIGVRIQQWLDLPISGGVIGLFLVLAALLSGVFKLQWIKAGSSFILGDLVLLFVPCVVGVIKYKGLFLAQGWQLVLAVTLGTILVMVATAYTVFWGFKLEAAWKAKREVSLREAEQK
ncbi:CidA/LrgA family protein [Acinetobacter thermotolerans]|uniref:CidA/LrgA family protein n=1 Tax=Acinetobacter thermotolerans TaxID=3151487 RepID=UPI00325C0538